MRADAGQVCADTIGLFDYGYNNFEKLIIQETTLLVPKGVTEEDITVAGEKKDDGGVLHFRLKDSLLYSKPITLAELDQFNAPEETPQETIEPTVTEEVVAEEGDSDSKEQLTKQYRMIIVVLAGLIILALLLIMISIIVKHNKRKKKNR
jgi:ABC-type Na+ efflux pump permease subunit